MHALITSEMNSASCWTFLKIIWKHQDHFLVLITEHIYLLHIYVQLKQVQLKIESKSLHGCDQSI